MPTMQAAISMTCPDACSFSAALWSTDKFTGKERDTESGLDYFGARYNASSLGRFMTPDAKLMTSRHLGFPQKWNKYAYVQNNPLMRIDPDGLDDYVVFKTINVNTGNWKAAEAAVKAHGDTFTMLSGDKATVAAWNKAISTPDTHAIFVGHTTHDMNPDNSIGKTNAIMLNDGRSAGQVGSESFKMTPGANPGDPPSITGGQTVGGPQVKADTVALFGCQSNDLEGQYGNTDFFGMNSGADKLSSFEGMDAAAAAFVTGQATGQDAIGMANTAFQQNATEGTDAGVKFTDKGDTVSEGPN